jgi:porphobilinogen deaminase
MVPVNKIRDGHHRVARLAAAGLRTAEIAEKTGYTTTNIGLLLRNPAMQELIAKYRGKVDAAFERSQDEFFALATRNMMMAERQIAERLEDGEESPLPIKALVSISRDAADRFGYGKRNMTLNVNADFAAELEKALARSNAERLKTIEPERKAG